MPRHEKQVARHFDLRQIEHFLPEYERSSVWANRQVVRVHVPLFPRYLFARFDGRTSNRVRRTPGVVQIIGNDRGPIAVPSREIEFLRESLLKGKKVEPYPDLPIGCRVRICKGTMRGIEGVLIRKDKRDRFALTFSSIRQSILVEVSAACLEPL